MGDATTSRRRLRSHGPPIIPSPPPPAIKTRRVRGPEPAAPPGGESEVSEDEWGPDPGSDEAVRYPVPALMVELEKAGVAAERDPAPDPPFGLTHALPWGDAGTMYSVKRGAGRLWRMAVVDGARLRASVVDADGYIDCRTISVVATFFKRTTFAQFLDNKPAARRPDVDHRTLLGEEVAAARDRLHHRIGLRTTPSRTVAHIDVLVITLEPGAPRPPREWTVAPITSTAVPAIPSQRWLHPPVEACPDFGTVDRPPMMLYCLGACQRGGCRMYRVVVVGGRGAHVTTTYVADVASLYDVRFDIRYISEFGSTDRRIADNPHLDDEERDRQRRDLRLGLDHAFARVGLVKTGFLTIAHVDVLVVMRN